MNGLLWSQQSAQSSQNFQLGWNHQNAMSQQVLAQWNGPVMDRPYLMQNSMAQQTCDAIHAKYEVKRICFSLLKSGQSIRDKQFEFGPWRSPGLLNPEEADEIEAEWEVEEVCGSVKKWFELCDFVAENEVNRIAPGLSGLDD